MGYMSIKKFSKNGIFRTDGLTNFVFKDVSPEQ